MKTKWDVEFEFEVGSAEKHRLAFHWGQALGDARVTVDGDQVLKQVRPFGLKRVKRYEVSVGDAEIHSVIIEKQKALVAAGVRKQIFRVLVDGEYQQRPRRQPSPRACAAAPSGAPRSVTPDATVFEQATEAKRDRTPERHVA